MEPIELAFAAALLLAVSGFPALFPKVSLLLGRKISTMVVCAGTIAGLSAAVSTLLQERAAGLTASGWQLPLGEMLFRLDPLSAFFIIPALLVTCCISLYACRYRATPTEGPGETLLTLQPGLISAAIIMLLVSANGMAFLIFWEALALLVFLAMYIDHGRREVRESGLLYLVVSHLSTLVLFILFSCISPDISSVFPKNGSLTPDSAASLGLLLAILAGFGLKAGLFPLHVWLPGAHANAPSHVSALMSGIVIKTGIYGMLRTIAFFSPPPLWWAVIILGLGIISSVVGVLFAIGQHDLKRLLAYHSIENIGIIIMGIGIALTGQATGNHIVYVLGMAGALLHVLNHALFKSLLFLGAGAAIHAAGTRDIDRMGGLSRSLPFTSVLFLTGSVAICGLPPLNGFVSEFLVYLGIFKGFSATSGSAAALLALSAPALALTGGLALACFVKVFGVVFLGIPRTISPEAGEQTAMTTAMSVLAAICAVIGVFPVFLPQLIEPVLAGLLPEQHALLPSIQTTAHLHGLSITAAILILVLILLIVWYVKRLRTTPVTGSVTWDCGYAAPSPSMQYTASSFAGTIIQIFSGVLRPEYHGPDTRPLFPRHEQFKSHVPEVVLEKGILPAIAAFDRVFTGVRRLQNGQLTYYILYIVAALLVLLGLSDFF